MAAIDPSARVHPGARLAESVTVGAFAVVEDDVAIGAGTVLHPHAVVRRFTTLGQRNEVHPFAVVGGPPQDRRHDGSPPRLSVGDDNVIREHVTLHGGSSHDAGASRGGSDGGAGRGGATRVGSGCLLMVSSHVAHDCVVGDGVILANATLLGGHVELEDHVVTGGHVALAPFVKVGTRAFLAGGAMVERDIPPFVIASGDRARVRALNVVGLERAGVSDSSRAALATAFRLVFRGSEPRRVAAGRLRDDPDPLVRKLARWVEDH